MIGFHLLNPETIPAMKREIRFKVSVVVLNIPETMMYVHLSAQSSGSNCSIRQECVASLVNVDVDK